MIGARKVLVFLLAGAFLLACATALMVVECGSDPGCAVSKLAFGYLLIGLAVAFARALTHMSLPPALSLLASPLFEFRAVPVPRKISVRGPPLLL